MGSFIDDVAIFQGGRGQKLIMHEGNNDLEKIPMINKRNSLKIIKLLEKKKEWLKGGFKKIRKSWLHHLWTAPMCSNSKTVTIIQSRTTRDRELPRGRKGGSKQGFMDWI